MLVGDQVRQRAGRGSHRHKNEKPQRVEPPRQRAAERQQPQHVETEMAEIGMQQRIGDEAPDFRAGAAGKIDRQQRRIVAFGNEAEHVDGPVFHLRRQKHPQMDRRQQRYVGGQRARQRQDRLARRILRQLRWGLRRRFQGGL